METTSQPAGGRRRPASVALEKGAPGQGDGRRGAGGDEERVGGARGAYRPEHVGRPVEKPTRQFAMLVFAPVAEDKVEELRALLEKIGGQTIGIMRGVAPAEPTILPFLRVKTIHYARFVLLERTDEGTGRALPPCLAFSTNYDGPLGDADAPEDVSRRLHLEELIREAGPALERIYALCRERGQGPLREYMERHLLPAATFYVGAPGRSCQQILWESDLRREIDDIVDHGKWHGMTPGEIRDAVRKALLARAKNPYAGGIPAFPAQPDLSGKVSEVQGAIVAGLVAVVAGFVVGGAYADPPWKYVLWAGPLILAGVVGLLAVRLRQLEETDEQFQIDVSAETHEAFEHASQAENFFLQNQLTHLVNVKPGPLRATLIRGVFWALNLLATNLYNKGKLGDIPSIHFARWVLIPDGGVLFFSNFDSSWQSYLGDFIDKASSGLTAVWSNTLLYPRTKWLLSAGSRDAARFLAWTRAHQHPTQVWYCAYPGLSIVNVNDNTALRRGLADPSAIDAAGWLYRLRSVNAIAADQLYSDGKTREPFLPLGEIQGLVLKGYGHKPEARYLMFAVRAPGAALRKWLSKLPLMSAEEAPRARRPHQAGEQATSTEDARVFVNVAFTYEGLKQIGVDPAVCDRFSTPFVQNSDHPYRARVTGDFGENAPEAWTWGSRAAPKNNAVHVALLVFADGAERLDAECDRLTAEASEAGLELVVSLSGTLLTDRKEHFGFRDGIGQPVVAGSGRVEIDGNTVAAGEFLLGHRDGYGNVTNSPETAGGFNFGLNGSYMVFRQLEQRVEAFWAYCDEQSRAMLDDDNKLSAVSVASKMVGRWPSGAPLVRHPHEDPNQPRFADEDNFTYLANDADNDRYGARCPYAAHVRRSNPRDWALAPTRDEALRLSQLHRIIRRGRPYGPPLDPSMRPDEMRRLAVAAAGEASVEGGAEASVKGGAEASGAGGAAGSVERGLHFICFNADLDRQFEFVQQQWCSNPNFAGLNSDTDPLVGAPPHEQLELDPATFTIQHHKRGEIVTRCTGLPSFVRVRGSSYFFMPSIPAVRLLGTDVLLAAEPDDLERRPPDEQIHIDSLIDTLRAKMQSDYADTKTLRDAHPKMHGLVRAELTVEKGLEDALRVGVFAEPRTYRAFVRLSNADGAVKPDADKDIRGLAIKLLDVPGSKLLDGHEACTTHDFLLISHDVFLVRDVAEFDALVKALTGDKLGLLLFLASHPRIAWNVATSLGRYGSLLDIEYFSAVPYLLGRGAVKYALRPRGKATPGTADTKHPNYLREDLVARLDEGPAVFDLMVQVQRDPESMPVEDPSTRWSQRDSPFKKVATLTILEQTFDTEALDELGENLSFNPWRALPEHRPLGGINRARRQVYLALSTFRHDRNAVPQREPTLDDWEAPAPESVREAERSAAE